MLAPNLPSFFRTPKPRQFEYKPFYYDETKEKRVDKAKNNKAGKREKIVFRSNRSSSDLKSNIRLIIIIIALIALAYYIIVF